MQDFIVLGIIPGTNVQLNFTNFVLIVTSLVGSYLVLKFVFRHMRKVILPLTSLPVLSINANSALIDPINIDEVTI